MEDIIETVDNVEVDVQKYIDTINDLKKTTVSREEYAKLKKENATLLESMLEGTAPSQAAPDVKKPSIMELRNELFGREWSDRQVLSDVEYVTKLCDLRDQLLEETGVDYMAPTGTQYAADYNDQTSAQKVYDALRHCLDIADGDNAVFHRELERITKDVGGFNAKRR